MEVSMNTLKEVVNQEINLICGEKNQFEETLRKYNMSYLENYYSNSPSERNPLSHKEIESELIQRHIARNEYDSLRKLESDYQLTQKKCHIYSDYESNTKRPSIFNYFERKKYDQKVKMIGEYDKDLKLLSDQIKEIKIDIETKVKDYQPHLLDRSIIEIENAARGLPTSREQVSLMSDIASNINQIERVSSKSLSEIEITLPDNYQKFYVDEILLIQNKLESHLERENISAFERTVDPSKLRSVSFQREGGPFAYHNSSYFDERGREYDQNRILENGKVVATIAKPDISEYGAYLETHQYIADRLLKDYPSFFDRDKYNQERVEMPQLKEIEAQNVINENVEIRIRQEKIRDFIPIKSLQSLPSQEYLQQAKSLYAKGHTPEKADEIITKSMLSKGFSNKAVAQALTKNSPQFAVKRGQLAATALVRDLARTPEVKRAMSIAQNLSR